MLSDQKYMIGKDAKNQTTVSQPWMLCMIDGSPSTLAHNAFRMFTVAYAVRAEAWLGSDIHRTYTLDLLRKYIGCCIVST
jgi:hypothetical protein